MESLLDWSERLSIQELAARVEDRVEEKIALLEPFVPQLLGQRLRTTRGRRLEGELRNVAVLFVEIWGLDEDGGASEQALRMARSVPRILYKYGGIFFKADLAPWGYWAMALFGLFSLIENDAERAILAALELTTRVKSFTVDCTLDILMCIGVHYG